MEHLIFRCKHCNKEYLYCTYGNGEGYGTEKGCTREYCAECANAIQKALETIPVKYEGRKQLITDTKEFDIINSIFDKCKKEFYDSSFLKVAKFITDTGYDKIEGCYIKKVEYHRCTKENGEVDIYCYKEFDLNNNKFTGKNYFENKNPCEQYFLLSQLKLDKVFTKETKPMEPPIGKLFFDDFNWDIDFK